MKFKNIAHGTGQAKWWTLRTPTGVKIQVKNLSQFIRDNQNLFFPEDVIWKRWNCRARSGIGQLFEKNRPRIAWKGWTAVLVKESKPLSAENG